MSVLLAVPGCVLALLLQAVVGGLVLFWARLGPRPIDWLVRVLLGLTLASSFHAHLAVGLTLVLIIIAATWRGHGLEDAVLDDARAPTAISFGAIAIAAVVAVARPAVPIFASDARMLALARSLSLHAPSIAHARPLTQPLMVSVLALSSDSMTPLALSGSVLIVSCFALFTLLVARSARTAIDEALPLIVLASVPLLWVHLRSVSVELPIGLAAASMALGIERAGKGDRLGTPAAITAALLLEMADEGIALGVGVALSVWVTQATPPARRASMIALSGLAIAAFGQQLATPGAQLFDAAPAEFPMIAAQAARHLTNVQTWGLVPAVGLAALAASLRRSASVEQRGFAVAIGTVFSMMLLALVLAPAELRERALEGGLINRLALESLPLVALLITRALRAEVPA